MTDIITTKKASSLTRGNPSPLLQKPNTHTHTQRLTHPYWFEADGVLWVGPIAANALTFPVRTAGISDSNSHDAQDISVTSCERNACKIFTLVPVQIISWSVGFRTRTTPLTYAFSNTCILPAEYQGHLPLHTRCLKESIFILLFKN